PRRRGSAKVFRLPRRVALPSCPPATRQEYLLPTRSTQLGAIKRRKAVPAFLGIVPSLRFLAALGQVRESGRRSGPWGLQSDHRGRFQLRCETPARPPCSP